LALVLVEEMLVNVGEARVLTATIGRAARLLKRPGTELPVEFTDFDRDVFNYVRENKLTMVSPERLIATINACKHALSLEGDFVECGVWRGGNSLAAKMIFERYGSDKTVWLFDTFAGMTAPTELDRTADGQPAAEKFSQLQQEEHTDWCFASLTEVTNNFREAGVSLSGVRFVEGDVLDTLKGELPEEISVLRLDTDWYESTKAELETLYPRLVVGGVLLIDDYGHWEGARKAVEEYFAQVPRPMLHFTDGTGRAGVKVAANPA
jgi:hypothetical protein